VYKKNNKFWNELCGSQLAKSIGVSDNSLTSLKKFDNWYLNFYPYLFRYIPFQKMGKKNVLEFGLGYGTVSEKLVKSGAYYTGLDIAQGPVDMVNHRIIQNNLNGKALLGDVLQPRLPKNSFDYIIAIGSLHHTGNLQVAINQCFNLLKKNGQLIMMVYNAYSYRRLINNFVLTQKYFIKELFGYRGVVGQSSEMQKASYDTNSDGEAPPHTDWISTKSLEYYCKKFSSFSSNLENIGDEFPFRNITREKILRTKWSSLIGLDIYATAKK
jgi:SAM-dependent methyltransferase